MDAEGNILIGTVPIAFPDSVASNGISHIIGGILLPPAVSEDTIAPTGSPTEDSGVLSINDWATVLASALAAMFGAWTLI